METIGNRLCATREGRGLSIEDAAHQTRIQAIYLHGLENDDYSNFPSTTYAKSFLTLYSRFLGVDADDALQQFAGGDTISLSGQGYLESVTDNIEPRRPSSVYANRGSRPSAPRRTRESNPGLAPIFLGVILLLLVIAIPTLWLLGKDAQSIDEVASKAKDFTNATFSTTDPEAEKVETPPSGAAPEEASKPGSPVPAPEPAAKLEPVPASAAPKVTKVAQVIASDGADRKLETQPGATKNAVITGENPRKPARPPLRALPAAATPAGPNPEATKPGPPPPSFPSGTQPLRAVPLIARPLVVPAEGEEVKRTPEPAEEDGNADPQENGNRYPRRPE